MTACLSVVFFAVKSWNFGLIIICLLFPGRGFNAFYNLRSSDEQGSTLICSSIQDHFSVAIRSNQRSALGPGEGRGGG